MVNDRTESSAAGTARPDGRGAGGGLRSSAEQPSSRASRTCPARASEPASPRPASNREPVGGAGKRTRLRKHMGVATSDPSYLPEIEAGTYERTVISERIPRQQVDYGKYLSQPRPGGRQIFTSPQERRRRRIHHTIIFILVAAMIVAAIWFFVLR